MAKRRRGALAKDPPKKDPPKKDPPPAPLRGAGRRAYRAAVAEATAAGKPPPSQSQFANSNQQAQTNGNNPPRRQPGEFKYAENKAAYDALSPEQQAKYNEILKTRGRQAANSFLMRKSEMPVVMPNQGGKPTTPPGYQPPPPATEQPAPDQPPAPGEQPAPSTQPATFADQPIEQQIDTVTDTSGNVINRQGQIAAGFDPATMQQNYQMEFGQQMDRYRQNIMDQFERRNERQFGQQRLSVQQQIAERGLDPASPAAQELMRQQNEREDMARQEAMSSAEQGAYGIQQQAFGQAKEQALMPGQIAQQFQDPFMARMGFQQQTQMQQQEIAAQAELARLEREAAAGRLDTAGQQALDQLRIQNQQRKWEVRNTPRGGGGGGSGGAPGLTPWQQMEANSLMQGEQPQINPIAAGAQGVVQGATGQVTNNLRR